MAARDPHTRSCLTPQQTAAFCSLLVGWDAEVNVSEDVRAWDEKGFNVNDGLSHSKCSTAQERFQFPIQ